MTSTAGRPIVTFPVTAHEFLPSAKSKKLTHLYEYGVDHSSSSSPAEESNALVFIGGLGDGPHGVPYIRHIAGALSSSSLGLKYTVFEVRLSSSFSGWGYSSLAKDVKEIASVVRYLRELLKKKKVVLMGHSTGCQDCVAYLHEEERIARLNKQAREEGTEEEKEFPEVDGVILQGPVSDREAIGMGFGEEEMEEARKVARRMIREGREDEVMPKGLLPVDFRGSPVTAYRWDSLASRQGDDDFFSSDLSDTQTGMVWNPLRKPVLVVPSEQDEWVPRTIDVPRLMSRWEQFCRPGVWCELSGLIPGANHRVDNKEGREWLSERVLGFLGDVDRGVEIGVFE